MGESFWNHVEDVGDCWNWTGGTNKGGYGLYTLGAHRFSYLTTVGPIPEGLHLDHLCRNVLCVNPEHLEPITQAENNKRQGAAITHCPRGHEYDSINTYYDPRGGRQCKPCRARAQREYYQRM